MAAIGIDFGTSNSRVAVVRNGKVEVLGNNQGKRSTPSVVAFTENERFIGDEAVKCLEQDPGNAIYNVKSLLGCSIQEITDLNFKVDPGKNNKAMIKVSYNKEEREFMPEEICAMLLRKMKSIAEGKLNESVETVVIGVPGHFNDVKRRALVDAGIIAGFTSPVLINETTASLLAMETDQENRERNVMIFDLGGGNFQASIANINEGRIRVKAYAGNNNFSGEFFTWCMVKHFLSTQTYEDKTAIQQDHRAVGRLRAECEAMKKSMRLMSFDRMNLPISIQIPKLLPSMDFTGSMSRSEFEDIFSDCFKKNFDIVELLLIQADITEDKLSEVVLAGCATPTPRISEELEKRFGKDKIRRTLNVEEAVARGAAVYAALFENENLNQIKQLDELMCLPIQLMCRGNEVNATTMKEYPMFPARREIKSTIGLSLNIDLNGVVGIKATNLHKKVSILLPCFSGNCNESVLTEKSSDTEKCDKQDEQWRNALQEFNGLESLCYKAKKSAYKWKDSFQKVDALENCCKILQWVHEHRNNISEGMKTVKEEYTRDLQDIISSAIGDKSPPGTITPAGNASEKPAKRTTHTAIEEQPMNANVQSPPRTITPPENTGEEAETRITPTVLEEQPKIANVQSPPRAVTSPENTGEEAEKRITNTVIDEQPRNANVQTPMNSENTQKIFQNANEWCTNQGADVEIVIGQPSETKQIQESKPNDIAHVIGPLQPSINSISDHSESSGPIDNHNDDKAVHEMKGWVNEHSNISEQQQTCTDLLVYYPGCHEPHKQEATGVECQSKPAKGEEIASNATLDTNSQNHFKDELPGSKSDDHHDASEEKSEIQQLQNIRQCDGEHGYPVEDQSHPQQMELAEYMEVDHIKEVPITNIAPTSFDVTDDMNLLEEPLLTSSNKTNSNVPRQYENEEMETDD